MRVTCASSAAALVAVPSRWLSDQWRDFLRPTTTLADGSARLTSAKGTRSDLYRVAVDAFEAHPLRGEGSGSDARGADTTDQ